MLTEVKSVEVKKNQIIIVGNNLEEIMTAVDLYKEVEEKEIKFVFKRDYSSHNSYLWKMCQSHNKNKEYKTIGDVLTSLVGQVIYISNSFINK